MPWILESSCSHSCSTTAVILAPASAFLQVWPKIIEIAAPLLFYGLTPAAYLATQATYRSAFIIINFWFVAAEVGFMVLARRNFIKEYYQDWSPKEVRQQGSAV